MLLSDDSDQPIVVTQLLLFRGLRAAFFSNFAIDDDSIYFSALVLIFPAFGTRHTFYADRAAAFLKYLRFSRQIDWNNFSHTDSSAVPAAFKRAQPKQKDGGDLSSACAVFSFFFFVRLVGLSKIYGCVAGCLG